MTPQVAIPLAATPSQTLTVTLGNQSCAISVYQRRTGLYLDLSINGSAIATGLLCRDRVRLVRASYRPFIGDLAFIDTQGANDPDYSGLGSRYILVWGT